jgi:hypothetical protein
MTTTYMEKRDRSTGKLYLAKSDRNKILSVNTAHERNPVNLFSFFQ